MHQDQHNGQENHRAALVKGCDGDRHHEQQSGYAEKIQAKHRRDEAPHQRTRQAGAPASRGERRNEDHGNGRQQAMVELHRGDVLGKVADQVDPASCRRRHDMPIHQRERILGGAGMQPSGETAGYDGCANHHQGSDRQKHAATVKPAPGGGVDRVPTIPSRRSRHTGSTQAPDGPPDDRAKQPWCQVQSRKRP